MRILPDVLRLIRRLAADKTLPSGVRTRLWLLLAYLALPFDLIPDFIPVLGYLDDLLIVPAGIVLTVRLIPARLMVEFREEASRRMDRPTSRAGVAMIALTWIAALALIIGWLWSRRSR